MQVQVSGSQFSEFIEDTLFNGESRVKETVFLHGILHELIYKQMAEQPRSFHVVCIKHNVGDSFIDHTVQW